MVLLKRTVKGNRDKGLPIEMVFRIIVVTHSLEPSIMKQFDAIVVMKSGRIAESGTFEELLKRKGYFYSLYNVTAAE